MQHGTVFWNQAAEGMLGGLDAGKGLVEQLVGKEGGEEGAFSWPYSPNWQDASTQTQCEGFDGVWGAEGLAQRTGSSAHHVCSPSPWSPHPPHWCC
jgi:xylulokinase